MAGTRTALGKRLEEAIEEAKTAGWISSQNDLEAKIGMPGSGYISHLKQGSRGKRLTWAVVHKIGAVLRVRPAWLVDGALPKREPLPTDEPPLEGGARLAREEKLPEEAIRRGLERLKGREKGLDAHDVFEMLKIEAQHLVRELATQSPLGKGPAKKAEVNPEHDAAPASAPIAANEEDGKVRHPKKRPTHRTG